MRNFIIVASALVGLAGFSGCGKKDKFDEVLGEMGTIKDKMCACTDKACVDKVQDEWKAYRKSMKDKMDKDAKPSEAQDKKGRELDDAMRTCRHKFDDTGSATTPTPTETAPAPTPAPTTP